MDPLPVDVELVGGPQDGSKVRVYYVTNEDGNQYTYGRIYLGARWLGDGYSAYSRTHSQRFPCIYVIDKSADGKRSVYRFIGT